MTRTAVVSTAFRLGEKRSAAASGYGLIFAINKKLQSSVHFLVSAELAAFVVDAIHAWTCLPLTCASVRTVVPSFLRFKQEYSEVCMC